MIALYNNVRSSSCSSDTLPSMPMFEYELAPTLHSLEFFKQSLESYLHELSRYRVKTSIDGEQHSRSEYEDDDIRDSALDTYSETSSLMESIRETTPPVTRMIDHSDSRLSLSSEDKQTLMCSSPDADPCPEPSLKSNGQIDRQISDEGYRPDDRQRQVPETTGDSHSQ